MFSYPLETWVFGPWDLFVEHGHRLMGAFVGLLTIALCVVVFLRDRRLWMRFFAIGALALVVFQGVLGGQRVEMNERQLAKIHASVGPAFFAAAVALAVFTSRKWRQADDVRRSHRRASFVQRFALLTLFFSYMQLVIGAQVRHVTTDATPSSYRAIVIFHLFMAGVVVLHVLLLGSCVLFFGFSSALTRPAGLLVLLVFVQVALGMATWVVKFGWPAWFSDSSFAASYTVNEKSMLQTNIVTAHVAVGSLIVATGTQLVLRSLRLLRPLTTTDEGSTVFKGAAI
jgi:cytochrome c oxidase assembly protein subunit 15